MYVVVLQYVSKNDVRGTASAYAWDDCQRGRTTWPACGEPFSSPGHVGLPTPSWAST